MEEERTKELIFKCDQCPEQFTEKFILELHERFHLEEKLAKENSKLKKSFKCKVCSKSFSSEKVLSGHGTVHTSKNKTFTCLICDRKFKIRSLLIHHIKSKHLLQNDEFHCEICSVSFRNHQSFKIHMVKHTCKPFQCEICSESFRNRQSLKRHIEEHTREPFQCKSCKRGFQTDNELNTHGCCHSKTKFHECEFCLRVFNTFVGLRNHQKHYHTESHKVLFKCKHCKKSFRFKNDLISHSQSHSEENSKNCEEDFVIDETCLEKRFICEICFKDFKYEHNLSFHKRSHTEADTSSLNLNQQNTEEKSDNVQQDQKSSISDQKCLVCPICSISCGDQQELSMHCQSHIVVLQKVDLHLVKTDTETPHHKEDSQTQTELCDDNQNTKMQQNFACNICLKVFKLEHNLAFHKKLGICEKPEKKMPNSPKKVEMPNSKPIKSHTQKRRRFICKVCKKVFDYAHNLSYHSRVHTVDKMTSKRPPK